MDKLRVKEIFSSFQGEGAKAGVPTTFIRLAGCRVNCPIKKVCDTDYSGGELFSVSDLLDIVAKHKNKHVCITGGEPLEQDIMALCMGLRTLAYYVTIQTSGTIEIEPDLFALTNHVVVSPKTSYNKLSVTRADELKLVYYGQSLDKISEFYDKPKFGSFYLQPLEKKGIMNTAETLSVINKLGELDQQWILCLQLHKFVNMR